MKSHRKPVYIKKIIMGAQTGPFGQLLEMERKKKMKPAKKIERNEPIWWEENHKKCGFMKTRDFNEEAVTCTKC